MEEENNSTNKIEQLIERGTVLDWARFYYFDLGWHILPGYKGEKHSYLERKGTIHEFERYDWEFLENEFSKPGVTNILLVTGKISGVTVVDLDLHKQGTKKSIYITEELPQAPTSITPGGGKHKFYSFAKEFRDLLGVEGCIDIRNNGLIVLPPSINKEGKSYAWDI